MKTDKKGALRLQTHLLLDRPRLTGLAGPDYDAAISFGLPFEPEDWQYGKSRMKLTVRPSPRSPTRSQTP